MSTFWPSTFWPIGFWPRTFWGIPPTTPGFRIRDHTTGDLLASLADFDRSCDWAALQLPVGDQTLALTRVADQACEEVSQPAILHLLIHPDRSASHGLRPPDDINTIAVAAGRISVSFSVLPRANDGYVWPDGFEIADAVNPPNVLATLPATRSTLYQATVGPFPTGRAVIIRIRPVTNAGDSGPWQKAPLVVADAQGPAPISILAPTACD